MATANPYDPKNRTISRTIYYSNQTGATVGSNISASPFPTAYGNYATTAVEVCTIDCSHGDINSLYLAGPGPIVLNDVTNNATLTINVGQVTAYAGAATVAAGLVSEINSASTGTWAGTLTITHHSGPYKVKLTINGTDKADPVSGGTLSTDHHTFAVTAQGFDDRSFADGLVEGGSSYTVNVKQGV